MAHDVFISYSSKDKAVADAVCAKLESQKIRCWIAPRDVPPGQAWAASIVSAIRNSRVLVLVFSQGSNSSVQVVREVEMAVDNGLPILPFRIENVEPSDEMRYFIKSIHWLDAMSPPLERYLTQLAGSVQALLAVEEPTATIPPVTPGALPAQKRRSIPIWAIFLLPLIVLGIIGGGSVWLLGRQDAIMPEQLQNVRLRNLSFEIPDNPYYWQQERGSYAVLAKHKEDAFAWSEETIEGDFVFSARVTNADPNGEAQFIVYGDGSNFSKGCLIFTYTAGYALITKDTIYHEGENWLKVVETGYWVPNASHDFTIEVSGTLASFYVDGELVVSAFIPPETKRQGRIGIIHNWEAPVGVTYSNLKVGAVKTDQ